MSANDMYLKDLSFEEVESIVDEMEGNGSFASLEAVTNSSSIRFKIIKKYGVLSNRRYSAIFSKIDWRGYVRYDLRSWKGNMEIPNKGITFDDAELKCLFIMLSQFDFYCNYRNILYNYEKGKACAKIFCHVGTLSTHTIKDEVWNKELNVVDWGYGKKLDFRKWTKDYGKCSKGICISFDEAETLLSLLQTEGL